MKFANVGQCHWFSCTNSRCRTRASNFSPRARLQPLPDRCALGMPIWLITARKTAAGMPWTLPELFQRPGRQPVDLAQEQPMERPDKSPVYTLALSAVASGVVSSVPFSESDSSLLLVGVTPGWGWLVGSCISRRALEEPVASWLVAHLQALCRDNNLSAKD